MSASLYQFNEEAASNFGAKLRAARITKGFTPEDISQAEKIPTGVVNALERGDYSHMGAPVYVRGFIRSYARAVDLKAESLDAEFETLGLVQQPELVANQGPRGERPRLSEQWMKFTSYLVGSVIMMSAMYFVMQADRFVQPSRQVIADAPVELPQQSVVEPLPDSVTPATAIVTAPLAIPQDASASTAVTPGSLPAPSSASTSGSAAPINPQAIDFADSNDASSVVSDSVEDPGPAPIAAAMTAMPSLGNSSSFALKVSEPVWAKVTDADGRVLLNDNLSRDTTRSFNGRAPFTVLVGNAADTQVLLSGQAVDFSEFVRGNVARFQVASANGALRLRSNKNTQGSSQADE